MIGIVLAAGMGRRIGQPKALLKLGDETFHARAIRSFQKAELDTILVVNALVADSLPKAIAGEVRLVNPDPDQDGGMFSSVKLAVVAALARGASGAILLPVDYPLVTSDDIRAVAAGLLAQTAIVIPTNSGRRGHPVGIGRAAMLEIVSDPMLKTLRDVVRKDPTRVAEVPASEGVLRGVNTQDELAQASDAGFSVN
ncbi:MAG: nucleotidyltransferase family protein [Vicinamibacteria bacterium]